MKNSTLVVIPTYNEKENLEKIVEAVKLQDVPADILVVDDNSPDGTGKIADHLCQKYSWVKVLHRTQKVGLGKAYVAGFKWGLGRGYKKLISMDADFSHPVEALSDMIETCASNTVALGSRYIKGGKIVGWNLERYLNSWGANLVTRTILQIRAKDTTAGFKCYPEQFLNKIDLDKIQSAGYAFQVEMLLLAQDNNFKIKEIPITFTDRVAGESKIQGELAKSAKIVFKLAIAKQSYRQFAKFAVVGAINTLVDWAVFYLLLLSTGVDTQLVKQIFKALSFMVSATSNYMMNRVWTFRSKDKKILQQALRFFTVALGGLVINQVIFYLITGLGHMADIYGLILATASATLWNFIFNKKWTFCES